MAAKRRVQYQGAIYHVLSRANGKAAIFRNDVDRRSFLQTLAEACTKTGWQVHAYWLMTGLGTEGLVYAPQAGP